MVDLVLLVVLDVPGSLQEVVACLHRLEGVAGSEVLVAGKLPPSLRVLAKMMGREDRVGKAARRLVRHWRREVAEGKEGKEGAVDVVDVDNEHNVRVRKVAVEDKVKEKEREWRYVPKLGVKEKIILKVVDRKNMIDGDDEEDDKISSDGGSSNSTTAAPSTPTSTPAICVPSNPTSTFSKESKVSTKDSQVMKELFSAKAPTKALPAISTPSSLAIPTSTAKPPTSMQSPTSRAKLPVTTAKPPTSTSKPPTCSAKPPTSAAKSSTSAATPPTSSAKPPPDVPPGHSASQMSTLLVHLLEVRVVLFPLSYLFCLCHLPYALHFLK